MSKKKLIILISCISAFVIASIVTTVLLVKHFNKDNNNDNTDVEEKTLITLQKPLNLKIDGYQVSWNKVENASEYLVYVGKNEYKTDTNSIDLSNKVNERDIISVKALGKGNYSNSVKSIELIFINKINEEEVNLMTNTISSFIKTSVVGLDVTTLKIKDVASKLYCVGVTNNDLLDVIAKLSTAIQNNRNIINKEKIQVFNKIINNIFDTLDISMNEYALVNSVIYLYSLYFEGCYKNNGLQMEFDELNTRYFNDDKAIKNYEYLFSYLNELTTFSLQNYTSVVHYYKLYQVQINNFINTLDGGKLLESETAVAEIVTLKNTLCNFLVGEMPLVVEYDDFKQAIIDLYSNTAEAYLLENVEVFEVSEYFNNLYAYNHYLFSFLNSLDDKESKIIIGQLISVFKSISPEIRNDFFEITSFLDLSSDYNIKTILEKHFDNIFGKYLFTINQDFIDKMTAISRLNNINDIVNELFDYFKINDYFLLNDSAKMKVENYFSDFIPSDLQEKGDFNSYLVEIFNTIDYQSYVSLDYEKLFNIEDTDKVLNLLADYRLGLLSEEEFNEEIKQYIDIENGFKVDYDGLLKAISLAFNEKAPKISQFFKSLYELDDYNLNAILSIFGITDEDVNLDASGFVEYIQSLIGFKFNDTFTEENLNLFYNNVIEEIQEEFSGFVEIYNIYLIFKNVENDDFTDIDVENIMGDGSINYMALYTLLNDLNIKFARFEAKYVPAYENGLKIGSIREDSVSFLTYLIFGIKAPYWDAIIGDLWDITSKLFNTLKEYEKIGELYRHYYTLIDSFDEYINIENIVNIYNNEEEFNKFIDSFDCEINKAYEELQYVLKTLPVRELILIKYHFAELLETNDELKEVGRVLTKLFDYELNLYDEMILAIDKKQVEYSEKSLAIRRIYKNLHLLIDPIDEFIHKVQNDFFSEGELTEDGVIDLVGNLIIDNKALIISFYNKPVMLELANDLNIVFADYPIDFKKVMDELCLYADLLVNRLNAKNLYSNIFRIIEEIVDVVSQFNKMKAIYDELILLVENNQFTIDEYKKLYNDYILQYNAFETSLLKAVSSIDSYMLEGIEELSLVNPIYEERKEDFLLMDNIETILEYLNQINESLEPKSESFVIEEFDLISAILKELITIPSVDLMLLSK